MEGTIKAISSDEMIVGVVSWVYWNGDEQGGGGFVWQPNLLDAKKIFNEEVERWKGEKARVRLLWCIIPNSLNALDNHGQEVTDFLDERIDELEVELPAIEEVWTK